MRRALKAIITGASYTSEAAALFSRMLVPPDGARRALIDSTIEQLKAAGIWDAADFIHFQAAHDAQAGRLDWKGAYDLTVVGATFVTDRGYLGDGVDDSLAVGVAPNALTHFTQNSATIATFETVNNTAATYSLGVEGAADLRLAGSGSGNRGGRINDATSLLAAVANSQGLAAISRTGASARALYSNGVSVATTGAASNAVGNTNLHYLRSQTTYAARRVGFGMVGGALSAAQHAALYTIVNQYMTAIGAA